MAQRPLQRKGPRGPGADLIQAHCTEENTEAQRGSGKAQDRLVRLPLLRHKSLYLETTSPHPFCKQQTLFECLLFNPEVMAMCRLNGTYSGQHIGSSNLLILAEALNASWLV